jgi:putative Mg2+ transporter-C (MgtC) family protein
MQPDLSLTIIFKLLLASLLGGLIGLERELHHKPAGLRTNLFMCVGSTLFTILSGTLARELGGDHTRIAAQIIPGIGFIGAGAILRDRGGVVGLTTAATIFVNASIGMAVGAAMYWTATFTTLMCVLLLSMLGWFETQVIKRRLMVFRVSVAAPEVAMREASQALKEMKVEMQHFQMFRVGEEFIFEFEADVSHAQQEKLVSKFSELGARCECVKHEIAGE